MREREREKETGRWKKLEKNEKGERLKYGVGEIEKKWGEGGGR